LMPSRTPERSDGVGRDDRSHVPRIWLARVSVGIGVVLVVVGGWVATGENPTSALRYGLLVVGSLLWGGGAIFLALRSEADDSSAESAVVARDR
jgi:drug/metabolite transporter (DMT)-like permease